MQPSTTGLAHASGIEDTNAIGGSGGPVGDDEDAETCRRNSSIVVSNRPV
jgi:hypothetical protein